MGYGRVLTGKYRFKSIILGLVLQVQIRRIKSTIHGNHIMKLKWVNATQEEAKKVTNIRLNK